jgi:hypothetical protein
MAEKRPTGEEMRQKMKEQYKQDLRKRKEFLDSAKEYKRTKTLSDAVVEIQSAGEDDTDVWVEKLNQDSAVTEAKMEMALDSTNVTPPSPKVEVSAATEAEMRKIQAQELVRQMKAEMEAENAPKTPPAAKLETPTPPVEKKVEPPVENTNVDSPGTADDRPPRKLMDDI